MPVTLDQCGDGFSKYLQETTPVKYRLKLQTVDAIQLTARNRDEVIKFVGEHNCKTKVWDPKNLYLIKSNNEDDFVEVGYYVVKEKTGTKVMAPDVFEAMYEEETQRPAGLKE